MLSTFYTDRPKVLTYSKLPMCRGGRGELATGRTSPSPIYHEPAPESKCAQNKELKKNLCFCIFFQRSCFGFTLSVVTGLSRQHIRFSMIKLFFFLDFNYNFSRLDSILQSYVCFYTFRNVYNYTQRHYK